MRRGFVSFVSRFPHKTRNIEEPGQVAHAVPPSGVVAALMAGLIE